MNEEEKQAIEFLKHSIFEYEEIDTSGMEYIDKNHKIIYKLILKQQKEIDKCEYYKDHADLFLEENKKLKKEIEALKIIHEAYKEQIEDIEKRYISKDKIKEKIELLKDIKKANCYKQLTEDYIKGSIEQLEELLGE